MDNEQNSKDKLLPCPFCGEKYSLSVAMEDGGFSRWVSCQVCEAEGPALNHQFDGTNEESRHIAISAWNRRTTQPDDEINKEFAISNGCEWSDNWHGGRDAEWEAKKTILWATLIFRRTETLLCLNGDYLELSLVTKQSQFNKLIEALKGNGE